RMESPASTQSAVTRCGLCVSYAAITPKTPTYSFPSAAAQSVLSVSTGLSRAPGRLPRCHSPSTPTCLALPAGSSSPTMATTRGPCSTTSDTRTSSTRSGTPTWRQTGSRTFGGTDDDGAGENSDDAWREVTSRAITCAVGACSACAPADQSRYQPPSSAGSACALWALAWPPAQPQGMARWEPGARQAPPCLQ